MSRRDLFKTILALLCIRPKPGILWKTHNFNEAMIPAEYCRGDLRPLTRNLVIKYIRHRDVSEVQNLG